MGSTTWTASEVKRLATQEPLVNHQNFSLDKLSSNPSRFSGNCSLGFFVLFCMVCFVFLLVLWGFFSPTTTNLLSSFSCQRLGAICLLLQLYSFSYVYLSTKGDKSCLITEDFMKDYRQVHTQNFKVIQIFKRCLCLHYSSCLKLILYNKPKEEIQNMHILHISFKKCCSSA